MGLFAKKHRVKGQSHQREHVHDSDTAVDMEYEMWLMPLHHFIGLSKMMPHQTLLREGKLAKYDSSMRAVFFLSHQWSSFEHPDPTGEQLRCMQRQVLKMLEGSAANVEPTFSDKVYLPGGVSMSGAEWKQLLDAGHVYIWVDYSCIPVSRAAVLSNSLLPLI